MSENISISAFFILIQRHHSNLYTKMRAILYDAGLEKSDMGAGAQEPLSM